MDGLIVSFAKYYPKNTKIFKEDLIRDPFLARDLPAIFDHKENEELIDLVTDVSLQATFVKEELAEFYREEEQRIHYSGVSVFVP